MAKSSGNDWMKDAQVGVDLVTLFSGNLDAFSQDPTEAWGSITGHRVVPAGEGGGRCGRLQSVRSLRRWTSA